MQKSFRASRSATSKKLTSDLSSRKRRNPTSVVKGIQAKDRVTDCMSQVRTEIQKSQNQPRGIGEVIVGCQRQRTSSSKIHQHRGDRLQSSPEVKLLGHEGGREPPEKTSEN